MKTTVDILEKDLKEAMRHSGVATKREAVAIALAEFNRRHRMARLVRHLGKFKDMMSLEELNKLRAME